MKTKGILALASGTETMLDAGVKFYASIGNHDDPANVKYPLWNMGGQRYYTFATKNVRFFALDSNRVDKQELAWLESALKDALARYDGADKRGGAPGFAQAALQFKTLIPTDMLRRDVLGAICDRA